MCIPASKVVADTCTAEPSSMVKADTDKIYSVKGARSLMRTELSDG